MNDRREAVAAALRDMAQRLEDGYVLSHTIQAMVKVDDWVGMIEVRVPEGVVTELRYGGDE